ncbi:uncharacterized protein EDB91DRAFT_1348613 [Suillus paluster]|uniref:uncharacterized protein n=1 Tax=Suillus paluster TaxID=48578 RepID=UPI001B86A9A8|nr:uncharacterized protein EDB91DRAFT_1348613 [Suillus paluster]KAG1734266.1 hypothetical protein EDB91DRAFT_1348613 [Suillus paluster]
MLQLPDLLISVNTHLVLGRLQGDFMGTHIDKYGPLIAVRSGTEKIVYIGRQKAAVDIMEKQSGSVTDRPRLITTGDLFSGGQVLVFVPFGDKFRQMRIRNLRHWGGLNYLTSL